MLRHTLSAVTLALGLSIGQAGAAPPSSGPDRPDDAVSLPALAAPLSDRSQARLKAGERIPVIVMLETGADGIQTQAGEPRRPGPERIAELREDVLLRAFGAGGVHRRGEETSNALAQAEEPHSRPTVLAEFTVTPGFALLASASEITRLSETPGVDYIVEDAVSRPQLNESTLLIGASQLWSQSVEGAGVAVAILDTGVEAEHPMTASAITASACFSQTISGQSTSLCPGGAQSVTSLTDASAGDSCVEDDIDSVNGTDGCSHGTHVGSTAAGRTAVTSSAGPISGVARAADIIAVNVFSRFEPSECGAGETEPCVLSYSSDQISALEWLYNNRASLGMASINMSLGGGEFQTACDLNPRRPVIQDLRSAGIATVIASGNDSFTDAVGSPACISEAITVGSTTKSDGISSFSNSSSLIDLLAPGSSILAAWQSEEPASGSNCFNGSAPNAQGFCHFFATFSGTSMATPHVAGAFALLKAAFPAASVDEIESALEFTGVQITDTRNGITRPRIQVDAAYDLLQNGGAIVSGLRITPAQAFETSGQEGDPGSFGTQLYTLSNESGSSLDFTVTTSDTWLLVDNSAGTLAAGADAQFTASVDSTALSTGANNGQITVSVTGGDSLSIPASAFSSPPPPANDDFENALPLAAVSVEVHGSNVQATKQTGEPNHGDAGGASVWWSWTAPFDGLVEVNTEGSDYDTTLGVHTGSSVDALTTIATNDDIDLGVVLQSRVQFTATQGQTYQIAVDGWNANTGNIVLNIGPAGAPANDNFASADPISGAQGSIAGFLYNATRESGEPAHDNLPDLGGSIWYTWTAPSAGTFRFRLDGTDTPAALAVYTGNAVNALTLVGKDLEGGNGLLPTTQAPSVDITAQSGESFQIAVAAEDMPGEVLLSWHDGADTTSLLTAILPYARSVGLGDTATAFISVYNDGPVTAQNCLLEGPPVAGFDGVFTFQTTDPATNALTGSPETPASIAPGQTQTFVFGITPNDTIGSTELSLVARCDNAAAPIALPGVNTFILTSTSNEPSPPDLLAIAATITNDGTVHLPSNSGTEVFTVAAVNIGSDAAAIDVLAEASGASVTFTLCETDSSGACLAPPATTLQTPFSAGQTRFFSIFVTGTGSAIPFDPGNSRVFVKFSESGTVRGATNVAVRTP